MMKSPTATLSSLPRLEQVYLIERDAGLLCRILNLYAARGLDVLGADYDYAAQDVMSLTVRVGGLSAPNPASPQRGEEQPPVIEDVRVLVAKVGTLVGVIAAAERPVAMRS